MIVPISQEKRIMLQSTGFVPGYAGDLLPGDEFVVENGYGSGELRFLKVALVTPDTKLAEINDEYGGVAGTQKYTTIRLKFTDADGILDMGSYSDAYPTWIKQTEENKASYKDLAAEMNVKIILDEPEL
jgi:hypothetical protein